VHDFDVGFAGAEFVFAWIGDSSLRVRGISAEGAMGTVAQFASLATIPGSTVRVAGRASPAQALVVGSGTDAFKGFRVENWAVTPPLVLDPGGSVPLYSDLAWAGDTALVAWTDYDRVSFMRVRGDGTLTPTVPAQLTFRGSTFRPRVAVAADGTDWLVAVSATDTLVYRVTAAGVASFVGTRGAADPGASLGLAHGPRGYVLVVRDQAQLLSERGDLVGTASTLPAVPGDGIEVVDAAADSRHVLVVRARKDRVMGTLLDPSGVSLTREPFAIEATGGYGERCAVSSVSDGRWLVAYGTWTSDGATAWFGTVNTRTVTVTP
jgi:hypothetical protein